MIKCAVKGCHSYYALGAESEHDQQYQESHQVLLKNEVERLRHALFNKVDELPYVVYKVYEINQFTVGAQGKNY